MEFYKIERLRTLHRLTCSYSFIKIVITEAKVLNTRAMHIAETSEKKLLRRMFDYWVQEAHKVQKAKNHASEKMMRRYRYRESEEKMPIVFLVLNS